MSYSISSISAIINGNISGNGNPASRIKNLLIDSRKLSNADTSLFFAIVGERHDGHAYLSDLFEKGVRNCVVSTLPQNLSDFENTNFILVPNTLLALQQLCAFHRQQYKIPVIGITGSNGKTIVKEWLFQLLRDDKNIVRSPKSFNSQVGVPLSVWQITAEHDLGIFEAGISQPQEMKLLEHIIRPTIGLITNIGQAHDENFENQKQKVNEKLKLFLNSEVIIYCKDYLSIQEEISQNTE
jgi:alanine racemase